MGMPLYAGFNSRISLSLVTICVAFASTAVSMMKLSSLSLQTLSFVRGFTVIAFRPITVINSSMFKGLTFNSFVRKTSLISSNSLSETIRVNLPSLKAWYTAKLAGLLSRQEMKMLVSTTALISRIYLFSGHLAYPGYFFFGGYAFYLAAYVVYRIIQPFGPGSLFQPLHKLYLFLNRQLSNKFFYINYGSDRHFVPLSIRKNTILSVISQEFRAKAASSSPARDEDFAAVVENMVLKELNPRTDHGVNHYFGRGAWGESRENGRYYSAEAVAVAFLPVISRLRRCFRTFVGVRLLEIGDVVRYANISLREGGLHIHAAAHKIPLKYFKSQGIAIVTSISAKSGIYPYYHLIVGKKPIKRVASIAGSPLEDSNYLNKEALEIIGHLKRLKDAHKNDVPKEIIRGWNRDKLDYKVRKNWWVGVMADIANLLEEDFIRDEKLIVSMKYFLKKYVNNEFVDRLTTAEDIQEANQLIEKIVEYGKIIMLTAYDAKIARALEEAGIRWILVGDSAAMVVHGFDTTRFATMDMMVRHVQQVRMGVKNKDTIVIGDMPWLAYETEGQAVENARRLIRTGATVVKVEGGREKAHIVRAIVNAGIAVMGHLGYTPQTGKLRVYGKNEKEQQRLFNDALSLQEAGAFAIVLEMVYSEVAKALTGMLRIPTVGIGAGQETSGQVLVINDILGISKFISGKKPRFAKKFIEKGEDPSNSEVIREVAGRYKEAVISGEYPAPDNYFSLAGKKNPSGNDTFIVSSALGGENSDKENLDREIIQGYAGLSGLPCEKSPGEYK